MGDSRDRPGYERADMAMRGTGAVGAAFANQVAYCENAGAQVTARIVGAIWEAIATGLDNGLARRVRDWKGAPLADALPLRVAGGLHWLHLTGREQALAPIYRGERADDVALVGKALLDHEALLLPWLDGPPQTNEAGRSSNFIAAMLWLAEQGLPARFECLEIGSSAGINLMLDRYGYDLGGVTVGPDRPVMHFAPAWHGAPPPDTVISIVAARGCDVAPVDLADPAQAMRLKAYIWPEHQLRFARMDAAIRSAGDRPPDLTALTAGDFVTAELARPPSPGVTRVLMHSIVWQYLPAAEQERIAATMKAAGAAATPQAPLAWIAVEADRTVHRHALSVRYWPGGGEATRLAWSHPHGADIEWLAGQG